MANPLLVDPESQEETRTSDLVERALQLRPESDSFGAAITLAQHKLEMLASQMGMSIEAFLDAAESSLSHNEVFLQGQALQRQIKFFKSQLK